MERDWDPLKKWVVRKEAGRVVRLRSADVGRLAGTYFIDGGTGIRRRDGAVLKIRLEDDRRVRD